MSNNIQSWKVKKIEKFSFPLKALYQSPRQDWHPPKPVIVSPSTMRFEIKGDDGLEIEGWLKENETHTDVLAYLTHISNTGEGSGTFYGEVLDDVFKESTGELEVIIIWESCDIEKVHVLNGKVTTTEIDL